MAQADGDGDGRTRRQWIIGRIRQIRAEFDDRAEELGGLLQELERLDRPVEEGRNRRLPPGWDVITGGGAVVAALVAGCTGWARRHWRPVATAAGSAAGAAVIAGALLAHGGPVPHSRVGVPPSMSASATASLAPSVAPSTARPKPRRTPNLPPTVPVLVPTRPRRPIASASGAPSGPAGPSPTLSRPVPSPSAPTPVPPPFSCPAGLVLEVLGIGLFVCV